MARGIKAKYGIDLKGQKRTPTGRKVWTPYRAQILAACRAHGFAQVCREVGISPSVVHRWDSMSKLRLKPKAVVTAKIVTVKPVRIRKPFTAVKRARRQ